MPLDGTVRRATQSQRARTLRVGPRRPQLHPLGYGLLPCTTARPCSARRPTWSSDPLLPLRAAVVAARARHAARADDPEEPRRPVARRCPTPWPEVGPQPLRRPAGGRARARRGVGGARPGRRRRAVDPGVGGRAEPAAAQRRAPAHRRPPPHRDRRRAPAAWSATSTAPTCSCSPRVLHDIGKVPGSRDHSATGAADRRRRAATGWASATPTVDARRAARARAPHPHRPRHPARPRGPGDHRRAVRGRRRRRRRPRPAARPHRGGRAAPPARRPGPTGGPSRRRGSTACRTALTALAEGEARARRGADRDPPSPTRPCDRGRLGGALRRRRHVPRRRPPRSTSSTATGWACSPTRLGCSRRTGYIVRSAIVRTVDGLAVNEWRVETPGGETPLPERIVRGLIRLAAGDRAPLGKLQRRKPARRRGPVAGPPVARPDPRHGDHARLRHARPSSRSGPPTGPGCSTTSASRSPRASLSVRSRAHRHVCRPDAGHVLRHRVRWRPAAAGPGGPGGRDDHRHLRRLTPGSSDPRARHAGRGRGSTHTGVRRRHARGADNLAGVCIPV